MARIFSTWVPCTLAASLLMTCGAIAEAPAPPSPATQHANAPLSDKELKDPRTWLHLAMDHAKLISRSGDLPDSLAITFGNIQVHLGDKVGALATAEQLLKEAPKQAPARGAMSRLAAASIYISEGVPEKAEPILKELEVSGWIAIPSSDPDPKQWEIVNPMWSCTSIAIQLARLGELKRARDKMAFIGDMNASNVADARCSFAVALARTGQDSEYVREFNGAMEEASRIPENDARWKAYSSIAMNVASIGKFDDARKAISFSGSLWGLDRGRIAAQMVASGKLEDAFKYVEESQSAVKFDGKNGVFDAGPTLKYGVMESAIVWYLAHGNIAGSHALAEKTCAFIESLPPEKQYHWLGLSFFQLLVRAQVTAGDPQGAFQTATHFKSLLSGGKASYRKGCFIQLAAIYARLGDGEASARELARADAVVVPKGEFVLPDQRSIVISLAKAGKIDEALRIAHDRHLVNADLATDFLNAGPFDRATELLREAMEDSQKQIGSRPEASLQAWHSYRLRHLSYFAQRAAKKSDLREVHRWIENLPSIEDRMYAELGIIEGMVPDADKDVYLQSPPAESYKMDMISVPPGQADEIIKLLANPNAWKKPRPLQ